MKPNNESGRHIKSAMDLLEIITKLNESRDVTDPMFSQFVFRGTEDCNYELIP